MDDDYGDAGYGDDEFGDVDAEVDAEDGEVCPSRHCCTPALTMLPLAAQAQSHAPSAAIRPFVS